MCGIKPSPPTARRVGTMVWLVSLEKTAAVLPRLHSHPPCLFLAEPGGAGRFDWWVFNM